MSLLTLFILISFVSSATTIQIQQEPQKEEKHWYDFLKSPIFWGAILFIIFLTIVGIGIVFLIKWIIQFFKQRSDIYYKLKSDRIKLSKIHKSYPSTHWWKVKKNTPIRLVRKGLNGKLNVSEPIGHHRGDYTTHEGNIIISLNLTDKKKYFLFPQTDVLVIPDKESIKVEQIDDKGKKMIQEIKNLPRAKDIVQFNPSEILLYADSLSYVGVFLCPVLRTDNNTILNLSLPVYQLLKEAVLGEYLYEQTNDFSILSKKSMNLNPFISAGVKLQDSGGNVEIPDNKK